MNSKKLCQMLAGINFVWLMLWFVYLFTNWTELKLPLSFAIGSSIAFNFFIWKKDGILK